MSKVFCVYILTNAGDNVLYTGITGNILKRLNEHKTKAVKSFSSKYNLNKLVYYEVYQDAITAIEREKQIKKYGRLKKRELIKNFNPQFKDLTNTLV